MTEPKLGQLIEGDAERDAIHVAIIPAAAGERLLPGAKVGRNEDGEYVTGGEVLGIVDPFLSGFVDLKERFWLFLLPNTVTGMRHHWEHPAFDGGPVDKELSRIESEAWLRHFCETEDCPRYEVLIAAASGEDIDSVGGYGDPYHIDSEYFFFQGRDAHAAIPDEFWDHVENVTGVKCNVRPKHFSCSC